MESLAGARLLLFVPNAMTKDRTDRPPTICDVAKLARVGFMTVSRVIHNNPNVRPGTLRKVNAAIAALGYQKNEAARHGSAA